MAANDTMLIRRAIATTIPGVGSTTTKGVEEELKVADIAAAIGVAAAVGGSGTVIRQTAPAAAPVPFADLTAAANYVNSLRTLLIAAGVLL